MKRRQLSLVCWQSKVPASDLHAWLLVTLSFFYSIWFEPSPIPEPKKDPLWFDCPMCKSNHTQGVRFWRCPNLVQLKKIKCGHHFGATIVLVRPSTVPCDRSHLRATITTVVDFPCMRPAYGGNHGSFLPCKRKCSLARSSRLL